MLQLVYRAILKNDFHLIELDVERVSSYWSLQESIRNKHAL